jgi:hypothetical protein
MNIPLFLMLWIFALSMLLIGSQLIHKHYSELIKKDIESFQMEWRKLEAEHETIR